MASERIPSYPLNDEYDIRQAFARIEDEIIASMMRNLGRHLKEEKEEGFDWSQWQVEQLKHLQELRRRNLKEYGPRFKSINEKIEEAIRDAHENGQKEEELNILKAISQDKKIRPKYANPSQASIEGAGDAFFRVNDRKLEALVEAAHSDMEKAEHAVLRRTNDQYRKIIFDAQMYANTGAGTIEKAIDMAAKDFLAKGIDSIEYKNGARHTISDYADMYLRTAERRAYLMGEGKKRQEWGEQLVIVNRRGTMTGGNYGHACPKCIPWLGKILIDDVYSGGQPDGKHQLLSEAMAAGFLHPRCKDGFTTYIPGISPHEDPVTKEEVKEAVEAEKKENRLQYAERQQERYERLAEYSLDPENRRMYEARAEQWEYESGRLARTAERTSEKETLQEMLRNSVTIGNPYVEPREIQSKAFSKKFAKLTDDSRINDRIRALAQGNLTKNNGTYTETLDIIDLDTGNSVIHKRGKKNALEVALTDEERTTVRDHKGRIIGIHNHPTNIFPTGSDFVVAGARGYEFGIVITHDLRVFKYTPPSAPIDALTLDRIIDKYTRMMYDDTEKRIGFEKAMQELERRFGITWQEM